MENRLRDFFRDASLTLSQMECVSKLECFLASKDEVFILKGYAGTGKTFMLSQLGNYLKLNEQQFHFVAPTGRAAKVLRKKTGYTAQTIHKLIYRLDTDASIFDDGNDDYKLYFDLLEYYGPTNALFIVDESSMVSDIYNDSENFRFGSGKLLTDLIKFVHASGTNRKLLFVGDNAQLPPVGSSQSPALSPAYLSDQFQLNCMEFELTDVYRQAHDSAILQNSLIIRDSIRSSTYDKFIIEANDSDIVEIPIEQSVDIYQKAWSTKDDESVVLIAHTNAHVYRYNRAIRKKLGYVSDELNIGDQLLIVKNTIIEGIPVFNGDFIKVVDISPEIEVRKVRLQGEKEDTILRYWNIKAELPGEPVSLTVKVYDNLLFSPERDIPRLERRAIMADFRMRHPGLKPKDELFATLLHKDPYFNALQVKFGYAVTCHKSQGGEWKEVIVDFRYSSSIYSEEYFRWVYTAMTRAKVKLHMIYLPTHQNSAVHNYESPGVLAMAARIKDQLATFNLHTYFIDYHQHHFILQLRTNANTQRIAVYYDSYNKITFYRLLDRTGNLHDRVTELIMDSWAKESNVVQEFKQSSPAIDEVIKENVIPYLERTINGYKMVRIANHQDFVKIIGIVRGMELVLNIYQNKERKFTKLVIEKGSTILSRHNIICLEEMLNRLLTGRI